MDMGESDWRPGASREALVARAAMLASARAFFGARGVLEVETPVLSAAAATDPALASFVTLRGGSGPLYLHTSPEFPMKRLLCAGSGDIYQICRVFRDGESGRLHNPEFTLLEWYRQGFTAAALMQEVAALLASLLDSFADLAARARYLTYRDAFGGATGLDPLVADDEALRKVLLERRVPLPAAGLDRDPLLDLIMSEVVLPALAPDRLTFIHDYPASQAALARLNPGDARVALRFEAVLGGMELANGFEELRDAGEQAARFDNDSRVRAARGLPAVPRDERFLDALGHGLPPCAGVAVGLDRVLMLSLGARHIDEVLAFPVARA